jgi:hypothetical protein
MTPQIATVPVQVGSLTGQVEHLTLRTTTTRGADGQLHVILRRQPASAPNREPQGRDRAQAAGADPGNDVGGDCPMLLAMVVVPAGMYLWMHKHAWM